jgi:hypothetical protein
MRLDQLAHLAISVNIGGVRMALILSNPIKCHGPYPTPRCMAAWDWVVGVRRGNVACVDRVGPYVV